MANLTGAKKDNTGLYFVKDSTANVKYGLDFTDYLSANDSLSTATVSISAIAGDASPLAFPTNQATDVNIASALVSIRLRNGTNGNIYTVTCTVTTANGDTDTRRFRIKIEDRLL
jgi:PBP1b-binding outer membrane lipoprotein LpoB